ncbi:BppU family phage baseplate upper protein [Enterococcus faecium]|uniref:BppU family phage baseplate upper protein n=1 Tax=Enterococcus faecium TaxID=1352 RepID=UPI004043A87E
MAHVIKKGSIKVPTQPKDYDLQATGLVFKSYDNQIALEFNVEQQNGTPADLLGANLRLLMFIYDEVDGMITKEPIPFITKNLITESFLNGQVVYILPEAMKAYNGMVEAYVYIEYPDGSTSDNLGFTFRMKRSAIDGLAQDKADYFIADFQQLLDGVKQETTDAVNEALAKVEAVSKNVSSAQNDLTILEDRIDQTNQQIGDLGKLKKMYSNSIDFGDYDYSGNPNLLSNLSYDLIENQNTSAGTLSEGKNSFKYNKISAEVEGGVELYYKRRGIANWLPSNKTLVMTVKLRAGADYSPADGKKILIRYRFVDNGTGKIVLDLPINSNSITQEWKEFSITGTTPTFGPQSYHPWIQFRVQDGILGEIEMSYDIKIEEGSTATPYQPNLLDAPHYLSKTPLGKNLITNANFPIKTSNNPISGFDILEELIIGETYTVSLKGTKPANKEFHLYYGEANYQQSQSQYQATLLPVEGLTDVWSATFTARNTSEMTNLLRVALWQKPNSATYDTVQIDWLKIEKGDTRTPNISQFKYFGEGLKDSNNPNDYSWDITPEYVEKSLNNTVSLTDPQTALGLKNFSDGIQIAGDHVVSENEHAVYKLDKSNSNSFIDGYATFIKHGKIVIVNGTVKFKKAYAFGVPLDDEVPEEFIARGVNGMIVGASGTSNSAKMIYVRQGFKSIMTNSEFAINEWFTFNGVYWVGEE